MRIAIVDESASSASIFEERLATSGDCKLFTLTQREGLPTWIDETAIDIVLTYLGKTDCHICERY